MTTAIANPMEIGRSLGRALRLTLTVMAIVAVATLSFVIGRVTVDSVSPVSSPSHLQAPATAPATAASGSGASCNPTTRTAVSC
jgi:hypothetical protein